MAIPLILCRLKDDHSVVHEIGETALVYFPDWEPVPTEQRELIEAENNMTAPPDRPASSKAPENEEPGPDEDSGPDKKVARQKPAPKKSAVTTADKDGE